MCTITPRPHAGRSHSLRRLDASHQAAIHRLYLGLDPDSRNRRFGGYMSPEAVGAYVNQLVARDAVLFGAVDDAQELLGICEAVPVRSGLSAPVTELAFTVSQQAQGKRIGYQLGQEAMRTIEGRLVLACAVQNPNMAKLARSLGFTRLNHAEDDPTLPPGLFDEMQNGHGVYASPGVGCA